MNEPRAPKMTEIQVTEIARRCTKRAIKTLFEIMQDPLMPPQARIAASKEILSRGWGQPKAQVETAHKWNDAQLSAMASAIISARQQAQLPPATKVIEAGPFVLETQDTNKTQDLTETQDLNKQNEDPTEEPNKS